jgi:hypothetical protein
MLPFIEPKVLELTTTQEFELEKIARSLEAPNVSKEDVTHILINMARSSMIKDNLVRFLIKHNS